MTRTFALALAAAALMSSACAVAQDAPAAPQMTMGNGEANSITVEGLVRAAGVSQFSEIRVQEDTVAAFRGDTVAITFPEVVIEKAGFLVLHPVMDGRPNGDMVSGFAYLNPGQNEDVTIQIDHPADVGSKFLVMLHSDVDNDRVLDFSFVEDGLNVEDTAVFEGTRMIAHIFAVPEAALIDRLQGAWRSDQDPEYVIKFAGHKQISWHGDEQMTEEPVTFVSDCRDPVEDPASESFTVGEDGEFCYSLLELTNDHLSFLYLPRGNTLSFSRAEY